MTLIQGLQGSMFFTENIFGVCVHNLPLRFRIVFAKVNCTKLKLKLKSFHPNSFKVKRMFLRILKSIILMDDTVEDFSLSLWIFNIHIDNENKTENENKYLLDMNANK